MEPAVRAVRAVRADPDDDVSTPDPWECDALMADGRPVHLRSIRPADAHALVEFHQGLSPDTVHYLR